MAVAVVGNKAFDDSVKDAVAAAVDDAPVNVPPEMLGAADVPLPLPLPPTPPPVLLLSSSGLCEWCFEPPTAPPMMTTMTSTSAMTIAVTPRRVRYHGTFWKVAASWPFSSWPCLLARATPPGL